MRRLIYSLTATLIMALGAQWAAAEELPSFIKPEHRASLSRYLTAHTHLSLMPATACQCEADLAQVRTQTPDYQPYYAVGDFNRDHTDDFAVVLYATQQQKNNEYLIDLIIFNGPFSPTKTNTGLRLIHAFKITNPRQYVLATFHERSEAGQLIPGRLDIGPSLFGTDNVFVTDYNSKTKRYSVRYFYQE